MGHQPSKVGFELPKTLIVRDALSGEELCRLNNVDAASTGLEVKERIQKAIKDFEPSSKRLLWGSTILCDHLTLGEVIACSLCNDGLNPNELSVLNRPAAVQQWLHKHKQLHGARLQYSSWTSMQRRAIERNRPDLITLLQFLSQPRLDQAVQELKDGGDDIRSDVECVAAVLLDDGLMLQHASTELQDVDFVVLTAVKENGLVLQYASPRLRDTDVIVSTAVEQNGLALQHASSRLQDADSVVTTAVKQNGLALGHASSRLQNDERIFRLALNQNGHALQFLAPKLKDDWSIVYIAFRQDTSAQRYASERIQARCCY